MKVLVTGSAGFIGYHLCETLLKKGFDVLGLDSINDYYSVDLKYDRLIQLGIKRENAEKFHKKFTGKKHDGRFSFVRMKLEEYDTMSQLFEKENFDVVCNLAAQAGVRYSLENPRAYVDSNVVGFVNILECCRHYKIKHLVYASSSSVYGLNKKMPFSTKDNVDHPISLYAASKKSNELMAHTYSHLYNLPTTGLRFFTVYGPWGRPDMAIYLFAKAITEGKAIDVFNHGDMERDFTYVDDIVAGIERIISKPVTERVASRECYKLYNIGNNKAVRLTNFIEEIELNFNTVAKKNMLPMQAGDVARTWANVDPLIEDYNYRPNTSISIGVKRFSEWFKNYHKK